MNRNDSQQALELVDAIPLLQGRRGRTRYRPDCVVGDRGYDAEAIQRGLRIRRLRLGSPSETPSTGVGSDDADG